MCIRVMLLLLSWMMLMIFYRDGTTILAKLIMLHVTFDKLTWRVRLKLHQSYCSSLFGCELYSGSLTVLLSG